MCRPHASQKKEKRRDPYNLEAPSCFLWKISKTAKLSHMRASGYWAGSRLVWCHMCGGWAGCALGCCDERRSAFHSLKPVSGTSFLGQNGKTGKTPFRHHAQVRSDATREKQDMTNAGRFLERSRFEGILEHAFAFSVMTKLFNISFSSRRSSRRLNEAFEKMTWHLNS